LGRQQPDQVPEEQRQNADVKEQIADAIRARVVQHLARHRPPRVLAALVTQDAAEDEYRAGQIRPDTENELVDVHARPSQCLSSPVGRRRCVPADAVWTWGWAGGGARAAREARRSSPMSQRTGCSSAPPPRSRFLSADSAAKLTGSSCQILSMSTSASS